MNWVLNFWRSTIGKKVVMGVTGLIGVGFVIGHMSGNLLVFRSPEAMNEYAAFLKSLGGLLWLARLILIGAVILHVTAAWQLTQVSRAARPVGYERRQPQVSTLASRTMRWGGVLVLVFIVFHILHFTIGSVHPSFSHTDVYRNIVIGFGNPLIVAFYVLAMLALGLHLYHGAWSSVRTLGLSTPSEQPLRRFLPLVIAVVVTIGFISIPLAVLLGLIG
ncbi:MAG TPA: succinate dehydrogenase cytochrome b subunit [Gemmatimonadaceae bacterium]|nr:succinate dehydrogenase cytochrome b subunit [Gemmatimonadaceae bacterium]